VAKKAPNSLGVLSAPCCAEERARLTSARAEEELRAVPVQGIASNTQRPLRCARWREGAAAIVIAGCAVGAFRSTLGIPPAIVEAVLLLAIVAVPLTSAGLVTIVRQIPMMQRTVFGCLLAAIVFGHFHRTIYDTFPFVEWDIYVSPAGGEVRLFDYYAVRRDGTEEHLVPADLFPSLRKKLAIHLEQVAAAIEAARATESDQARSITLRQQYDGMLRALARAYNRQHAENPLVAIRIERWTVPVEHYAGRASIARRAYRVWRLESESE
jgi:hypothetical protein